MHERLLRRDLLHEVQRTTLLGGQALLRRCPDLQPARTVRPATSDLHAGRRAVQRRAPLLLGQAVLQRRLRIAVRERGRQLRRRSSLLPGRRGHVHERKVRTVMPRDQRRVFHGQRPGLLQRELPVQLQQVLLSRGQRSGRTLRPQLRLRPLARLHRRHLSRDRRLLHRRDYLFTTGPGRAVLLRPVQIRRQLRRRRNLQPLALLD